jgi:hypothetical protein
LGLTIAIVVVLWQFSPVAVLLTLSAIYAAVAGWLYRRFLALQRDWRTFPETIDQLRKDRVCLEKSLG